MGEHPAWLGDLPTELVLAQFDSAARSLLDSGGGTAELAALAEAWADLAARASTDSSGGAINLSVLAAQLNFTVAGLVDILEWDDASDAEVATARGWLIEVAQRWLDAGSHSQDEFIAWLRQGVPYGLGES